MRVNRTNRKWTIGFDGDDTLWHNENILWSTEQKFQKLLLNYLSPEELSRNLYQTEMRNLSLFGYGAKGFVLSMIETAIEVTEGRISTEDIQKLLDFLKEIIRHPVHLIDDSDFVVRELSRHYQLLLISKGELFHQEQKVASSGLANFFSGVEIVSDKTEEVYRSILAKYGVAPSRFVMVGNSVRSDIDPILKIGAHAIHVPYELTWKHEEVQGSAAERKAYWRCESLLSVASTIREIEKKRD